MTEHVRFFDERLEFDDERFHPTVEVVDPSADDIAAYGKYVTIASKMENEAPIIALVYIERILAKTGLLVNKYNWKRILLVCMCVASKVWDDDSLENVHFPKVMADVTIHMINRLEKVFLDYLLNYDLVVKGSEYAKYYFIMRTLANELRDESLSAEERSNRARKKRKDRDDWAEFPLRQPIAADQMLQLQRNSAKAEIYLKDRYEKEMILAIADKFKGEAQKIREKKFLTAGNYVSKKGQYSENIRGMLSSTM